MAPSTESILSYLSDFYNAFSTAGEMKYHLANLLDIKEKQLQKAGSLGQRVMTQQMELEERVRWLQLLEEEKDKVILKAQYRELAETILSWDSENVQLFSAFAGSLQPLKAFEAMIQPPDSALSQMREFDQLCSAIMGGTTLHLKNLLAGKEKQLQQASNLGQRIMAQQMKLDEYIRQLQELEADKEDDDEIGLEAREQYRELANSILEWDSENMQLSIAFAGYSKWHSNSPNNRLILSGGTGIPTGPDGTPKPLLPPISPHHAGRKCLILDLDETLVHSGLKPISQADYVIPVEIEHRWHHFHVNKRPGLDNFLKEMGEIYEVVAFTASLSKYADPALDKVDIHQVVAHRLFRESCYNHKGNYVKAGHNASPQSTTVF